MANVPPRYGACLRLCARRSRDTKLQTDVYSSRKDPAQGAKPGAQSCGL
jgi:hypothetical protein